jgi:hypothetical protein
MRKSNQQTIGQLLDLFIKQNRLETGLSQAQLQACWIEITGEYIAKHTSEIKIYKNVLYVKMDNAACREELMYKRSEVIVQVNKYTRGNKITEINIR